MKCKDQKQKKILNFTSSLPKPLNIRLTEEKNFLFTANKSFGQNFLNDTQICDQIALSCGSLTDNVVIEIGPGMGSLTQAILALHPGVEIIAIEADTRFIPVLQEIAVHYSGCNLQIIEGDALQFDFQSLVEKYKDRKINIIANLPYNIGTELVFKWLKVWFLSHIDSIVIMLQKEVVNRIVAENGSKDYSWLSILSQLLCDVELLFNVPKEAFIPQPKVTSSVVSLRPKKSVIPHNIEKLKIICHELFLHRRKTVKTIINKSNKLQYLLPYIDEISLKARPEDLNILTLCRLSLL
jgi:16S rRNA (adenine1518-N6/adenine1519-N6)-dimethyltransferase